MNSIDKATLEVMHQLSALMTRLEHNPSLQKLAADFKRGIDINKALIFTLCVP